MTILFLQDWQKHPGAILHTTTNNHSWVRLSALYRDMGIQNHGFPLALLDQDLLNIDPHSTTLTDEEITKVVVESKNNFWYYAREVVKIPATSGLTGNVFRANRGNISMFWLFFNHITLFLVQIRQTGKSASVDVLMRYLLNLGCMNTAINLITKDDTLRHANLDRLKEMERELPLYMRLTTTEDVSNTEMTTVKALGNKYTGHLPQRSPKAALNVGRGLTSPIFHIDELTYLYNLDIMLPAALAAGTDARVTAELKGEPHGTIMTTTCGRKDDDVGKYVHDMIIDATPWSEHLFDSPDQEVLKDRVRSNGKTGKLRVNCTFNHRQLGYTDAWVKRAIEDSMGTGDMVKRDFLNIWTDGTLSSPFKDSDLARIRNSQVPEVTPQFVGTQGYMLKWTTPDYERYTNAHMVLGNDTSDAVGADDIALALTEVSTGKVVATACLNETNIITYAGWLFEVCVKFPNMVVCIERRSSAVAVIDYLIKMMVSKGMDPFARIFNWVVQEYKQHPKRFSEINKPLAQRDPYVYIQHRKHFGFATSGRGKASRDVLYVETLNAAMKYGGMYVHDPVLVDQLSGLTVKNGRIDHASSGNDDLVIAWLLSWFFILSGENLSFYGISARSVLSDNQIIASSEDAVEQYDLDLANKRITELMELLDELKDIKDPYVSLTKLKRVSVLRDQMGEMNSVKHKIVSMDGIDQQIESFKKVERLRRIRSTQRFRM